MATAAQPFLHELVTCFAAPTAVLSASDGQLRALGAQGILHADVRVLSQAVLTVEGLEPEPIAVVSGPPSGTARFTAVVRVLGEPGADPTALIQRDRMVTPGRLDELVSLVNGGATPVEATICLDLRADLASVESVKAGSPRPSGRAPELVTRDGVVCGWRDASVGVDLRASGALVEPLLPSALADAGGSSVGVRVTWQVRVPARDRSELSWSLQVHDDRSAVVAVRSPVTWSAPVVQADDRRLAALVTRSLHDLAGLRMATRERPGDEFCAAGSPWYFTLFGRDSLWAAKLLLPLGTALAASTLRALAAYQGTVVDDVRGEAPGKIPHELRRASSVHGGMVLPSLYYGTVDATPLWITLLHDAWRWGLGEPQVRALLPHLKAALGWLTQHGDTDGDGFLEYVDVGGQGLANQGWKDSGDAIKFGDGSLATGPIALSEVQGYAYEAAIAGADLLDAFDEPGSAALRGWAFALQDRFRQQFWVGDGDLRRPALALDALKRPVDSVTTNMGHLLGTGILNEAETDLVARRVTAPDMRSGFGLRTMSAADSGYWPLSYHCGSVWPHDTAIVVRGLARTGRGDLAASVIGELLRASAHFDARLPELYSGHAADDATPVPYPASCRPQAWSAAASIAALQSLLGLDVDVPGGRVRIHPCSGAVVGALSVDGLVVAGRPVRVDVDRAGSVVSAQGLEGLALTLPAAVPDPVGG